MTMPGPLIILSGPSGSGKSTVIHRLLQEHSLPLRESVSVTTRRPRKGERDGVDYHFWTPEQFRREVQAGGFLEWAEVYGSHYGTLKRTVDEGRQDGAGVILVIDVQGAAQVRSLYPDAVSIFLRASSMEDYRKRLRDRGTDDQAAIERRVRAAEAELSRMSEYDYVVVNDNLEQAVAELRDLLRKHFATGPAPDDAGPSGP